MNKKNKISIIDIIIFLSSGLVTVVLISTYAIFIFLILLIMPVFYNDVQDYQTCLDKHYYKEDISHFPKIIPEGAKDVRLRCFPCTSKGGQGSILLKYKADKNYIESELKKYEFINPDEPIGTPQKIYNMPSKFVGINPEDMTYYPIKTPSNESANERGYFPYYSGIGVSKNMDYILYYEIVPD